MSWYQTDATKAHSKTALPHTELFMRQNAAAQPSLAMHYEHERE